MVLLADPFFPRLKALVIDTTGMHFYADKDGDLARIVADRMDEVRSPDCASYLLRLTEGDGAKEEMDSLVAELTIGETYFFRHKEQFDALREIILPEVLERNRHARRIRIWSAGCSIGPEPYSIAIMIKREFAVQTAGWHISVLGTDINQKFLARAREGRYDEWAFRATPDDIRADCFEKSGRQWVIRPEFRSLVHFQYHNLIRNRFPSILDNIAGFDVIICRNVIIYFNQETIAGLIPCFRDALVDGGWLVMGHAEPNQELFRSFQTINTAGAVLYRKADDPQLALAPAAKPALELPPAPAPLCAPAVMFEPLPPRPPLVVQSPAPPPPAVPQAPVPPADELARVRELSDAGRWDEAARACDAMIKVNALNAQAHFYRSLIHEQMGELDDCEKSLRRSIYLDRHSVLPHYHLGLFLLARDDASGASRSFRNVLALLDRMGDESPIAGGDDITAGQLRETVGMQLKLIGG